MAGGKDAAECHWSMLWTCGYVLCVTTERVIGDDSVASSDRHVIKPSRACRSARRRRQLMIGRRRSVDTDTPPAHRCQTDRTAVVAADQPAAGY